jgi:DNA replication protein DnaC
MLFQEIKDIPLLILDDLGAQGSTQWAEEKLFQVINYRYVNSLATVVTTNLSITQMDDRLQNRMTDPLHSQVINLGAPSNTDATGFGSIEPEMRARMTFENFDLGRGKTPTEKETLSIALNGSRNFSKNPDGSWLVLKGRPGSGKTHLAIAVANEQINAGNHVFFAFIPELLDYLRYTFNPENRASYDERFDEVKNAPLLILDDYGAGGSTRWAEEKLYQLIVYRHNRKAATIITMRDDKNLDEGLKSRLETPNLVMDFTLDRGNIEPELEKPRPRGQRHW